MPNTPSPTVTVSLPCRTGLAQVLSPPGSIVVKGEVPIAFIVGIHVEANNLTMGLSVRVVGFPESRASSQRLSFLCMTPARPL
jgi:hypothetical protein